MFQEAQCTGANSRELRCSHMKRVKFLLQKFPQYANDFVFFTDKKVFSVTSSDNRQNKVSGRLRELLKKKFSIFFSAGAARSAMPGRLLTVHVSHDLLNSLLTPRFVQLFWGNSSVNYSISSLSTSSNTNFLSKSCPCPRRLMSC